MATPSWLRRLSEAEDGKACNFHIPTVSLYSSSSSLGSLASRSRRSSVSNDVTSGRLGNLSQDSVDGTSSISEKIKTGGGLSRFSGPSSSQYRATELDSVVSADHLPLDTGKSLGWQVKDEGKICRPSREDSWSYVDSEGYARLPVC